MKAANNNSIIETLTFTDTLIVCSPAAKASGCHGAVYKGLDPTWLGSASLRPSTLSLTDMMGDGENTSNLEGYAYTTVTVTLLQRNLEQYSERLMEHYNA